MQIQQRIGRLGWVLLSIGAAVACIVLMLLFIQQTTDISAGPMELLEAFWKSMTRRGSLSLTEGISGEISDRKIADVIIFWIPLVLVSMGLVVTFRAGLWNIGIEGQIAVGGLFAAGVAFSSGIDDPPTMIFLSILAAMLGGALWALLSGILRTRFGVNEIFSGVALNALANQITLQMIAGPWRPGDSDKAQYSRPLPDAALLPHISDDFDVSSLALLIAVASIIIIALLLWRSRWSLNLKSTGFNARSALLLGVPVGAAALSAMMVCGALAGIAGMQRVQFFDGGLRGQFAGGIGFLGLLIVLLVGQRPLLVPFVAFLFAVMLAGGTQLQFLGLDTSLTGVLQGMLVLLIILFGGVRDRLTQRHDRPPDEQPDEKQALATGD